MRSIGNAESARDARIARLDDAALLSRILDEDELSPDARKAFSEMLQALRVGDRAGLSRKQRTWAEETLRGYTPVLAADAPRGREVPLPEVLQNLPKKPPGRR